MVHEQFGQKVCGIIEQLVTQHAHEQDLKRENANINGDTSMGSMLQIGANVSKEFYLEHMVPADAAKAHRNGDIHIHDLDFYGWTTTCTQIELLKLFEDGFDTGHGHLREPKSIRSYAALAAIAIQSNQNDQHGGQSVVDFDYAMAKGVRWTYDRMCKKYQTIAEDTNIENPADWIRKHAMDETVHETYQAMEGFVHNLNTMHSRAGAQVPFSSINYGMDTSWEGRLAIEQLLLATEAGLGHGETPIFPIQIFRVKEGINYNPGDPNYDLFRLAIRVSAKRLFPNFSFVDAPFNKQYYKEGHPETEIAYMGAVTGDDIITIRVDGRVHTLPFSEAYTRFHDWVRPVEILDRGQFVEIKAWQNYPDGGDWCDVKFSNGRYLRMTSDHPLPTQRGRVLCQDLQVGDEVPLANYTCIEDGNAYPPLDPWVMGVLICDSNRDAVVTLGMDEQDVADALIEKCGGRINVQKRGAKGNYLEVFLTHGDSEKVCARPMQTYFGSCNKKERRLPVDFTAWHYEDRMQLLAGILDADGHFKAQSNACYAYMGSTNKKLALQEMILAESLGFHAKMVKTTYGKGEDHPRYTVCFRVTKDIPVRSEKKRKRMNVSPYVHRPSTATITEITFVGATGQNRYDVTTESDRFDVSGINSHNCRTRVIGNVHDPERQICPGRGNLSFTSINLPRLAIAAQHDERLFIRKLDDVLELVADQLLARLEVQSARTVANFPFLMGQGVWIDSENLDWNDSIGEVLKHGTLSIGFIGLAETLKALYGAHHGESEAMQEKGLMIIQRIRDFCDFKSQETGLNFTCLATPAEGLSGRFVRIDRQKYGSIPGVTDREYYTNSFHVPVYYPIDAFKKLAIEAPYHALTNAGHISYIEMDGDPTKNLAAFEKVVRYMHDVGIGYGSINHPVDRDPVCGYSGVIGDTCPKCGRTEHDHAFERLRRITGYLVGTLNRWNNAKRAEESDRVKHTT